MNKWKKSPLMKGILIFVVILAAGCLSIGILLGNRIFPKVMSSEEKEYLDSEEFEADLNSAVITVLDDLRVQNNFESDGRFNENKLVDIESYADQQCIDGKNTSGVAYKMSDILDWSESYSGADADDFWRVVVCQKPDGSYHYYYMDEFQKLLNDRKLFLYDVGSVSGFLMDLEKGYYDDGGSENTTLIDAENNVVYTGCWTLGNRLMERYKPEGYDSILEVVNSNPKWNGKLTELYSDLEVTLGNLDLDYSRYKANDDTYQEGNTNFHYLLIDRQSHNLISNYSKWNRYESYEDYLKAIKKSGYRYCIVQNKLENCKSNVKSFSMKNWKIMVEDRLNDLNAGKNKTNYIFVAAVDQNLPIQDEFQEYAKAYEQYFVYRPLVRTIFFVSIAAFLIALIWLTVISGRRTEDPKLHLQIFDRIPTELAAGLTIGIWIFGMLFLWRFRNHIDYEAGEVFLGAASEIKAVALAASLGLWSATLFLLGYLSLVRRMKGKLLWENSILRRLWRLGKIFWKNRSVVIKLVLTCLLLGVFQWAVILRYSMDISVWHFLLFAAEVIGIGWLLWEAVEREKIRKGVKEIASGNLEYQISTTGMKGDFADITEQINHIRDGLQHAVEKSLKDERLKTDLITNVSHDIKTPLTSIINYVDLLKRENFQDPKIQNYLEILEKKSQRLKQLTEDVVEASKISSGNITLECMNLNLAELVCQIEGEFEEKFEAKNLQPILHLPEEPAVIYADGRRMWRVLENIYNNAAKYAMPGTRIYLDVTAEKGKVKFSMKNVSEQPLNISADELTERFIRGDLARNSEGSGLGLSIAQNLTKLQKGVFRLYLDGDLFRVTLEFPQVKPMTSKIEAENQKKTDEKPLNETEEIGAGERKESKSAENPKK